ncbi:MAG: DUF4124 domain-containing protein, partial [Desulfobacterales bacterium]|nr:DUF4124 domain-containing protein [Desulfobacterales bacterium]
MIKKICIAFTSLTFFLATGFAMAETYKYVDENGNIHFTDDLSMVPENQRLNLNYYQDSQPADPVRKNEKQTDLSAEGDEI